MTDPKLYRVSLLCSYGNDLIYGYGSTEAEAEAVARSELRRHEVLAGERREVLDRIVERAVTSANGSSHYEEVTS